ncbi:hypothetical protein MN0502_04630 [Arthrobacter sp. MN05-02]|nr:hypothetical protein MN0502_04630 [Arthrobacter sp. MN05-02]
MAHGQDDVVGQNLRAVVEGDPPPVHGTTAAVGTVGAAGPVAASLASGETDGLLAVVLDPDAGARLPHQFTEHPGEVPAVERPAREVARRQRRTLGDVRGLRDGDEALVHPSAPLVEGHRYRRLGDVRRGGSDRDHRGVQAWRVHQEEA